MSVYCIILGTYIHVYITIITGTYIKSITADRCLWGKRMGVEMGSHMEKLQTVGL